MKRLILASSSPRRYDLLLSTGLPFEVARPDIDETPYIGEASDVYVLRLSREKAFSIASNLADRDSLILSADTTVVFNDRILGKPETPDDAIATLQQLRERTHLVHTGITILDVASGDHITRLTTSHVTMRSLTDDEIVDYVASGDPMGKAGSYAIQNTAFHPVDHLNGCFTNVVGLPLCTTCDVLAAYGVTVPHPIQCSPANLPCQFH